MRDVAAGGAGLALRLMFGDLQGKRRQVVDLTALGRQDGRRGQVGLTIRAASGRMHLHLVRRVHKSEGAAVVSRLPARLAPARLAQRHGLLCQPVRRRRLAAVVAVFVQTLAQFLDFGLLEGNLLLLRR